jgi:hypothetical protein
MAGTSPAMTKVRLNEPQPARAGKYLSAIFHFFIDLID